MSGQARGKSGSLRSSLRSELSAGSYGHGCCAAEKGLLGHWGLPRCANERHEEPVKSDVAAGLPGEDEEEAEQEHDRVRAGAAGEHEVQVHERPAHGGDAGERTEDESETDRGLTERDHLAHDHLCLAVNEELDEAAVPVVGD